MLATTCDRYLEAPLGRYVRGRTWLSAAPCAGLYATFIAGRPTADDLRALGRTYAVRTGGRPHAVLFDGSRVEAVDAEAHDVLLSQFKGGAGRYGRHLERVAVVHGRGLAGALFAGYPKVIGLRCEARAFHSAAPALRWLGVDAETRRAVLALAESLEAPLDRVRLAALLAERPGANLRDAARALAMAPRTLQRLLEAEGTTYRRELDEARAARTTRALGEGDASITAIALDAGFASLQAFSDWFRARVGEAPSAYRARVKGARAQGARVSAGGARATRSARGRSRGGRAS